MTPVDSSLLFLFAPRIGNGLLHGLPDFVERLYRFAGHTIEWLDIGLPGYHFALFGILVYLLYFTLSLPVRLLEKSIPNARLPGRDSTLAIQRLPAEDPKRPSSARIGFAIGRVSCFVLLWWFLDRTTALLLRTLNSLF